MVGYNKHDSLTTREKFIAGCVSGITTRFVTQPLDVIKVRLQIIKHTPKRNFLWVRTARNIIYYEGIKALFQGHSLGQMCSVGAVSTQFYVYELATEFVQRHTPKGHESAGTQGFGRTQKAITQAFTLIFAARTQSGVGDQGKRKYTVYIMSQMKLYAALNVLKFFCGVAAGCTSVTIMSPLEVVRTRQMSGSKHYKGLMMSFVSVYKTGGIFAFYQGLSASLLMMGPQIGISFYIFNMIQPRILKLSHDCKKEICKENGNIYRPETILLASSVAGVCSGFISKTATYPLDLIRKRMQVAPNIPGSAAEVNPAIKRKTRIIECRKLGHCVIKTLKHDGVRGLYRGWLATIFKAQVTNVVAFSTYEMVCFAFRERKAA